MVTTDPDGGIEYTDPLGEITSAFCVTLTVALGSTVVNVRNNEL